MIIIDPYRISPQNSGGDRDLYFSYVRSLCHFDGARGSSPVDKIPANSLVSKNATVDDSKFLFGNGSAKLGGNSSIEINSSNDISLSSLEFTVEISVLLSVDQIPSDQYILGSYSDRRMYIYTSGGAIRANIFGNDAYIGVPRKGLWERICISRDSSGRYYSFMNGELVSSDLNNVVQSRNATWFIGAYIDEGNGLSAYYDEWRLTIGVCRYTKSYSVSDRAFPDA